MTESKASRTLVKSPPELWSEVSSATSLQRHMDQFGEIRITKLEPETAVAWEGEHARGTITLEASGWGTKVSLTAEPLGPSAQDGTAPELAAPGVPEQVEAVEPEPGDCVKPEPVKADDPDPASAVAPEPAEAVAPQPAEAPSIYPPHRAVEAEMSEPSISPQRDRPEAQMRKRRWTRRLAEMLRGWLSAPPQEGADPVTQARQPEPDQRAASPGPPQPEPEERAAFLGPAQPEPRQPGTSSGSRQPEPAQPAAFPGPAATPEPAHQDEALPQPENASTAALDAALDSLGQAHHRPFSRA